jgi:hypothetical protein
MIPSGDVGASAGVVVWPEFGDHNDPSRAPIRQARAPRCHAGPGHALRIVRVRSARLRARAESLVVSPRPMEPSLPHGVRGRRGRGPVARRSCARLGRSCGRLHRGRSPWRAFTGTGASGSSRRARDFLVLLARPALASRPSLAADTLGALARPLAVPSPPCGSSTGKDGGVAMEHCVARMRHDGALPPGFAVVDGAPRAAAELSR